MSCLNNRSLEFLSTYATLAGSKSMENLHGEDASDMKRQFRNIFSKRSIENMMPEMKREPPKKFNRSTDSLKIFSKSNENMLEGFAEKKYTESCGTCFGKDCTEKGHCKMYILSRKIIKIPINLSDKSYLVVGSYSGDDHLLIDEEGTVYQSRFKDSQLSEDLMGVYGCCQEIFIHKEEFQKHRENMSNHSCFFCNMGINSLENVYLDMKSFSQHLEKKHCFCDKCCETLTDCHCIYQ